MEKPDLEGVEPFDMIAAVVAYLTYCEVSAARRARIVAMLRSEPYPRLRGRCERFIDIAPQLAGGGEIRRWFHELRETLTGARRGRSD